MQIHLVRHQQMRISQVNGKKYTGSNAPDACKYDSDDLVVIDADIPNTAGNPTIKDYLEAEVADGFGFKYMDQNTIITQHD